jgi:hypothetical protein
VGKKMLVLHYWLLKVETLLAMDHIPEEYWDRFQVWFNLGYSPEKAAEEFKRLLRS